MTIQDRQLIYDAAIAQHLSERRAGTVADDAELTYLCARAAWHARIGNGLVVLSNWGGFLLWVGGIIAFMWLALHE